MHVTRVGKEERGWKETGAKVEIVANSLKRVIEYIHLSVSMYQKRWDGETRRTAWAAVTYLLKKARNEGSSSIMTEPLRALTKSIAGCIEACAALLFRSGFT